MDLSAFVLADVIRERAQERPDETAYVYGERRLTFADVDERSSRAANVLLALGVGAGDRIAILAGNCPEFFELCFAAGKTDAMVVGLNWRLAAPELAAVLADADPALIVVEPDFEHLLGDSGDVPVVRLDDDDDGYERRLTAASAEDPRVPTAPDHPILMLYSSGTTGLPKGVTITNANLAWSVRMSGENYRMTADTVNLVAAPLFHIGGAGWGLMAMFHGGTGVISRDAAAAGLLGTIERERVTHAFLVPAVIQTLVDAPQLADTDVSSLQQIAYGAAPMTEALLRRAMSALGCTFLGVYGMTEITGTAICLQPSDHVPDGERSRLLRSVGRPVDWLELKVVDLATGEETEPGVVGEIQVRSEQVSPGYWRQPETTAHAFTADGWLRTGDGAYRDEEGFVFLKDRIKDMIISGGENVFPAEVENALADHPAIADVAVIGVPHERWGETVKAIVVLRDGEQTDAEAIRAFAKTKVASYKCPTSVEFVEALPRNPSGKILKKTLREQWATEAS